MTNTLASCPQCSTPFHVTQAPTDFCLRCRFPLCRIANKYQMRHLLGQGGAGKVYLAEHVHLAKDNLRVVKLIQSEHLSASLEQRFIQEVQVTATLSQSNNHIVRIYDDFGYEEKLGYYYIMEYLQGQTLRDFLQTHQRLPLSLALHIFGQLCDAMHAAHQEGIIHRDLKPDNLFLLSRPQDPLFVKVLDFGIAYTLAQSSETGPIRGLIGTPLYMSPEQCLEKPIDERTDIYAMGLILYELLTGELPFASPLADERSGSFSVMFAHVWNPPLAILQRWPTLEIPEALDTLILQTLSKAPDERPQSVEQLWHQIVQETGFSGASIQELTAFAPQNSLPLALQPTSSFQSLSPLAHTPTPIQDIFQTLSEDEEASFFTPYQDNLPAYESSFIGRQKEVEAIEAQIDAGARLLTLLGPGGTGKSRLSVHYGETHRDQYPGGIWFCDLTQAHQLQDTLEAVANALQVPLQGRNHKDQSTQIGHAIAGRRKTLLLLDNFEQVVSHASDTLTPWLALAPDAHFLVSTRERLRVPLETCLEIPPLPHEDAVTLFIERAQHVRSTFALTPENRSDIDEIVKQLDQIPLAIELAAARINLLNPHELRKRLHARFQLLTHSPHTTNTRQATLRSAIDWSWKLLEPWEQESFVQCAIFEGGFTLDAAERVLDTSQTPDAPWILDRIQALKDKSLLRAIEPFNPQDPTRFQMYESIRAYAAEKLAQDPQHAALKQRHANHYLQEGEELHRRLTRHDGQHALRLLKQELDNLTAIFRHHKKDNPTLAARALLTLEPIFSLGGNRAAYLQMLDEFPSLHQAPSHILAHALAIRGDLCRRGGRLQDAQDALLRSLSLCAQHQLPIIAATAHNHLGNLRRIQGKLQEAHHHHQQALSFCTKYNDPHGQTISLGHLGNLQRIQGHMEDAEALHLRALSILRERGDRRGEGIALGQLGNLYRMQGRAHEATRHYQLALEIHRAFGDRNGEGIDLNNLGNIHFKQGRLRRAHDHYLEALTIHKATGDRRGESIALGQLANLYLQRGHIFKVEKRLLRANELHRELGDRRGESIGLNNLGNYCRATENLTQAYSYYQQALTIQHATHDQRGEAFSQLYLGLLALEQGHQHETAQALQRALSLFSQYNVEDYQGITLSALGTWHRIHQRPQEALRFYQRALPLLKQSNLREEALTRAQIGALRADLEERTSAETSFQIAAQLLQDIEDPLGKIFTSLSKAHLDLAYMREAQNYQQHDAAQSHKRAVDTKIRTVENATFGHNPYTADPFPATACSSRIRIALRILKQQLP